MTTLPRRALLRLASAAAPLALLAAALSALPSCGTSRPAHVTKTHGLGASSVVFVEGLETKRTGHVGRAVATTPAELAARFRVRLLQQLREHGMQTRDADGVPDEGVLVEGSIDTVDGGTTDGVRIGGQRLHCTIRLFNCAMDRSDPAFELKITGTPAVHELMTEDGAIVGAAEDAADQVARFIRENP